jgi:hypothetical protein
MTVIWLQNMLFCEALVAATKSTTLARDDDSEVDEEDPALLAWRPAQAMGGVQKGLRDELSA